MADKIFIDSIRDAIIAYRADHPEFSDRDIAKQFDISNAQLSRWVMGAGSSIRTSTLNNMMPFIGRYLTPLERAYCLDEDETEREWIIQTRLVHPTEQGSTVANQLAHWFEFVAGRNERDDVLLMAKRCGFKVKAQERTYEPIGGLTYEPRGIVAEQDETPQPKKKPRKENGLP